jgi:hypothetical protein
VITVPSETVTRPAAATFARPKRTNSNMGASRGTKNPPPRPRWRALAPMSVRRPGRHTRRLGGRRPVGFASPPFGGFALIGVAIQLARALPSHHVSVRRDHSLGVSPRIVRRGLRALRPAASPESGPSPPGPSPPY